MVYNHTDQIMSMLKFPEKCEISIDIDEENNSVTLQVGPRDWEWDKTTGEMIGCGTMLGNYEEEDE